MQSPSSFFESLFKRELTNAGNAAYLQNLADEHPYFSPAQFYLLQQKELGSQAYNTQAAKTAILFNNNYWLNFQLLNAQQPINSKQEIDIETNEATAIIKEDEIVTKPEIEEINIEKNSTHTKEETIAGDKSDIVEQQTPENENQLSQNLVQQVNSIEEAVINNQEKDEVAPVVENEIETASNIETENKTTATEVHTVPQKENNVGEEMLFQPLHSTDYFASQGIKLSEDFQPDDKLGKQLKSFTDWLKTMKKINPQKISVDHNSQTDTAIQTLAEKSNAEGEVLTETMAEIFLQQGKTEKAVEVYEKLSLLNPSKNTYFAAKIEQLKGV